MSMSLKSSNATLISLAVEKLKRGKYQPRRNFDPEALTELAESIKANGLIQPIVVRPLENGQYEIVAGERRWRAAQLAQLDTVPCLIQNYDDEQTAAVTVIENLQRRDLNPIEEAQSFLRLIEEFGYSHEEVGAAVGKSRAKISNVLRLLRLDDRVQQWLIEGQLGEAQGKVLASLPLTSQYELARCCIEKGWSVRQLEAEVKRTNEKEAPSISSTDAHISRLERRVSDHIGTQVKFDSDGDPKSGWLKIRYFDLDTLGSVLEKLGVADE